MGFHHRHCLAAVSLTLTTVSLAMLLVFDDWTRPHSQHRKPGETTKMSLCTGFDESTISRGSRTCAVNLTDTVSSKDPPTFDGLRRTSHSLSFAKYDNSVQRVCSGAPDPWRCIPSMPCGDQLQAQYTIKLIRIPHDQLPFARLICRGWY